MKKSVAVLGTGAMGSRMAGALLRAGHEVTVWNRDANKALPVLQLGARAAATPRDAAREADFVLSMVRDDGASRDVWLAPGTGALEGVGPEAVAIESSTLSPRWVRELAALFKQRRVSFLDAPVAGSRPQADAAQLVYLVGGEGEAVERATPMLMAMGSAVHHAGPSGSGAAVKLIVNALLGIQVCAVAELLSLARHLKLDPGRLTDILAATPVLSPAAKGAAMSMNAANFAPLFPVELVRKDFDYLLDAAASEESPLPLSTAASALFARAAEIGLEDENLTTVAKLF